MNLDSYNEVINGEETYKEIAQRLYFDKWDYPEFSKSTIIGWTDGGCDHRDILFTYKPSKLNINNFQRGMRWCDLFISIIDFTSYGFVLEKESDNRKHNSYFQEKLRLRENSCDNKICELINGVIHELDILEGYYKEEGK